MSDRMVAGLKGAGLQTLQGKQHPGLLSFHAVPWKQAQGIRQLKRMF